MGTKAVFKISGYNDQVVGMCMDGFPDNLAIFARDCYVLARKLRVLTKFMKEDKQAIKVVLEALVEGRKDWLFLCPANEPAWVSHAASLDIPNRLIRHFNGYSDGRFEDFVATKTVK